MDPPQVPQQKHQDPCPVHPCSLQGVQKEDQDGGQVWAQSLNISANEVIIHSEHCEHCDMN